MLSTTTVDTLDDVPAQHFSWTVADTQDEVIASPQAGTASPGGFTPAQLRHAYGFDQVFFEGGSIVGDGAGQTIAIVGAYHNPTAANDLAAFSAHFGIANAPSFIQVAQDGTTNYPITDPAGAGTNNWELEAALDVQWAHAMAPGANILLVEANTANFSDLMTAVDYARNQPGVSVVSMSFGALEFAGETSLDFHFTTPANHSGVAFVAASGDAGSPGVYPGYSRNVLAVGGTTLTLNGSNNIANETAWSGSGGGISVYESQPSWQNGFVTQSATKRGMPDVAFVGNPSTGVPVYDSYNNGTSTPWTKVAGTSFGAPVWAALVAIADQGRDLAGLPTMDTDTLMSGIYSMPAGNFNDVILGSSSGSAPQSAAVGYDLVTGRGSPKANLVIGSLIGSGSVTGKVFNDIDGNGVNNADAGLLGWTVYADLNANGLYDPLTNTNVASADIPKTINTGTVNSTRNVTGITGRIVDLNVTLNVSHTRDSDLVLTLVSPTGTRITLASHVGSTGDNFTNTVFDDSGNVAISLGVAPFAGTYQPTSPLSVLYGTDPNGTWTLEVQDTVAGTNGTLNSWSMQFTTGDPNDQTDASGTYVIDSLPAGAYQIREVLLPSFTQTAPLGGFHNVNLSSGSNLTGLDFGNQLPPTASPSTVTLLAATDTGASNSDQVTSRNNSSGGSVLQFQVTGTIAGAIVNIYSDGTLIGSAIAAGTTTTVTTDAGTTVPDGPHNITARQAVGSQPESGNSSPLVIQVDTQAPIATLTAVSPDPRTAPVNQMTIVFDEAVSGFELADLLLSRNGGGNLLSGAQTLTTSDNITWTLGNLTGLTAAQGVYQLALSPAGAPLVDLAGNVSSEVDGESFTVGSSVVSRLLFYNASAFDNNDVAIGTSDDLAIATDKSTYLPGSGLATFDSVSSYSRGINGIMIDISGTHPAISANDFVFKVGNDNAPGGWSAAPAPLAVSVRAGAGVGGSDRVVITWANSAIKNQWLEVQVLATANTGLAAADLFFWGNKVGDVGAGTPATLFLTSAADATSVLANAAGGVAITQPNDFNRDGNVTAADKTTALNNAGTIVRIDIGGAGPFAPLATVDEVAPTVAAWQASPIAVEEMTTRAATVSALATSPVVLPARQPPASQVALAARAVAPLVETSARNVSGYDAHVAFGLTADAFAAWSQAFDELGADLFADLARGRFSARRR